MEYQLKRIFRLPLVKNFLPVFWVAVGLLSILKADAQQNWDMALRSGINFPVKNNSHIRLETGLSFEATLVFTFTHHMAAYAGWGLNAFDQKSVDSDLRMHFEETGYTFGLQYKHAIFTGSGCRYVLGAGCTYNHIETENTRGDIINDSGHGIGWQAETGLAIALSERALLIPTLRYRELSRVMTTEGLSSSMDLNYFSAGIMVTWTMWCKS